jgi:hypothetical protein
MVHLKYISKALTRFVLLLFLIQFLVPAFVPAAAQDSSIRHKTNYSTQHDSGIAVALYLKENTEEKNESTEKAQVVPELIDFSFLSTVLKQSHSRIHWDTSNLRHNSEPLFKLLCIFLI